MKSKRHHLGQHFLKDPQIIDAILDTTEELLEKYPCPKILEIGPGKGAITLPLLQRVKNASFLLAEKDDDFIENWKTYFSENAVPGSVLPGDFVRQPTENWLPDDEPLAVVSNLPYSAGTAILNRLADHPEKIPFMVLMFQLEVALRLRATPGNKKDRADIGSLTLWIQNRWEVRQLVKVPPRCFQPPPRVDSEVVVLLPRDEYRIPSTAQNLPIWQRLISLTFAHRRQMLRRTLKPYQNVLAQTDVDATKRPEQLTWDEWGNLFEAFLQHHQDR